jgi:Ca2+-binding RTX toxin-like protein
MANYVVKISRLSQFPATSESGKVAQYNVSLPAAPMENVTINFASSDLTEGKLQNSSLTFTPDNWSVDQTLYIEGVDDDEDDKNVAYSITGTVVTDDLTYNRATVPVINLTNLADGEEDVPITPEVWQGTALTDYFQGKNGADILYAGGGQDQIKGGRGDDEIYGENDNDRLFGELGNDVLYGGYGKDSMLGGVGDDSLFGEQGNDSLLGEAGNDFLDGGIQGDTMIGGAGNDTYTVDSTSDLILDNGASTDVDTVIVTQSFTYTLAAGIENATSTALGDANLTGNSLSNDLTGNSARNVLDGGTGNDELAGGGGNDTLRGGAGVDCADFEQAGMAVTVNLQTGTATGEGSDLLFDIENICSGSGNDKLTGSTGANDIVGGAGKDVLSAGGGNDTLTGCAEDAKGGRGEIDKLTGGAGSDYFDLGFAIGTFYDDGNRSNRGTSDYALITDFTYGTDKLVLKGSSTGYYFAASQVSGVSGIGVWAEQGTTDELIAVVQSTTTISTTTTISSSYAVFI